MDEFMSQLEKTLSQVVSARSSAEVKVATEELQKNWYKRAETVPALVQILQAHPEPQMRQLAGVEVRKLIPRFWYGQENGLSEEAMEQIKSSLLRDSLKEENDLVRHTVARIISAIAHVDLDENRWPALLPELNRAAQSTDVREREVSTYVLFALLDSSDYSAAACEQPRPLMELLGRTMKDPESLATRVNSVLALSGLSTALNGNDATMFQHLVPEIVGVLRQCIDQSDEKSAGLIFESLSELIDSDPALLGASFGELLGHMLSDYGLNDSVEPDMRVAAMQVVSAAASFRYNRINRLKLGPDLTAKLVEVVANSPEDEDEEDDDNTTASQVALQTLETLAARLPPSQVIAPLVRLLSSLAHASNPSHLRAGYLAFTATADGAPEFVASETDMLLPWIVQGLRNENAAVRLAALQALVQLGELSGDKVGKEHAMLVPLVFGMLDTAPSLKVCRFACFALGTILRTLRNEIITNQYLPELVPRLLEVVRTNSNLELKGFVISTIGTAAEVSGRNFIPYFEETLQVLEPFVSAPAADVEMDAASAKLVSEALGTMSRICGAIGAEKFAPYLDGWMKTALVCLASEDSNLREMAPLHISDMAAVYQAAFGVYVPHIIPALFDVLQQDEISIEDVDLNDPDADLSEGLKVNSALCMEKEFSLDCLASLWQHIPAEPTMMPYLVDSLENMKQLADHFYEEARISANTGLWRVFESLPTNAEVKAAVWESAAELLEQECDISVLTSLFSLIGEGSEKIGAQMFPDSKTVQLVLNNVFEIVNKTHRVYEEYEDGAEEDKEAEAGTETSETTTQMVQSSLELLTQIATVLAADFGPLFTQVAEALQPYAASTIDGERVNGVGAFADLVGALKENITPWTEALLSAFSAALNDSAIGVRSVAAYGIGLLAEHSTNAQLVKQSYSPVFSLLAQVVQDTSDDRAVANGAGAVARLASKYPDAVPVSQQELLGLLLPVLPLKEAYEEYVAILPWLVTQQLPGEAKPLIEELWKQHLEAEKTNAVKSVNYLPADDPLGQDITLAAWNELRKKFD